MNRALIITAVMLLFTVFVVTAATSNYDLSWFTVDGGGGVSVSSSDAYRLIGTIGQADAGPSGNGELSLSGGFLRREPPLNQKVFLPAVIK
jgi:hypothetical protein